jgi:hypothetical protein
MKGTHPPPLRLVGRRLKSRRPDWLEIKPLHGVPVWAFSSFRPVP